MNGLYLKNDGDYAPALHVFLDLYWESGKASDFPGAIRKYFVGLSKIYSNFQIKLSRETFNSDTYQPVVLSTIPGMQKVNDM